MAEFQKQVETEVANIEALKNVKDAGKKLSEYCDQVVGTAKSGTKQLTDLEGKLESEEAKTYLKQNTPGVVNTLRQIAEKGRAALKTKGGSENYTVYPGIESLHSELKQELNSLKDELTNFEKIETADAGLQTQLGAETAIVNNGNASLDERLNAYNGISTGLDGVADKLPKEVGSAAGREYLQKINGSLTEQFERITYERQNLNIAKRITEGGQLKLKVKPEDKQVDLTKIQAPAAGGEPLAIVVEGTTGRDYSQYFKVDERGGVTMTPALEELSKSNPDEYRRIIGDLYAESGGVDLEAKKEEMERISADIAFYVSCVGEYEKNPTPQSRELVLQNALPGGGLPAMNGRAGDSNPALDAIYGDQDIYVQEYNEAAKIYQEAAGRFEGLEREADKKNNKMAQDVLKEIDSSWQTMVAPQLKAYGSFEKAGFKEIMNTVGLPAELIPNPKRLKLLIEEHNGTGDDALKMLLTVQKLTGPLKRRPLDGKVLQHLDKIEIKVREQIDRIESNKLRIRTAVSLQGMAELKGELDGTTSAGVIRQDISRYVTILDKPNEQGKRYVINEEELNKLPQDKREAVKIRIDGLVDLDLQSVKAESSKILDDKDQVTPEAEAKLREKFGKNGEKYFQAMDKLKNGDLRTAGALCREFIAFAKTLDKKSGDELQNLLKNANETLKLIGVRQVAALEDIYKDLSILVQEQFILEKSRLNPDDPAIKELAAIEREIGQLKARIEKGEILDVDAEVARVMPLLISENTLNKNEKGKCEKLEKLYNATFDIESEDPEKRKKAKETFLAFAGEDLEDETGKLILVSNNPEMYRLMKKYLEKGISREFASAGEEAKIRGITPDSIKREILQSPGAMTAISNAADKYYERLLKEQPELKGNFTLQQAQNTILNEQTGKVYQGELQRIMGSMDGVKDDAVFQQYNDWFPVDKAKTVSGMGIEEYDSWKRDAFREWVVTPVTMLATGGAAGALGGALEKAGMALYEAYAIGSAARIAIQTGVRVGALCAEGSTMMFLNDATQLALYGETPAYIMAKGGVDPKKLGLALAQNIMTVSLFKAMGEIIKVKFPEGAYGMTKAEQLAVTELLSALGGTAISTGFTIAEDPNAVIDGTFLAKNMLQNASSSLGILGGRGAFRAVAKAAKPAKAKTRAEPAGAKKPPVPPVINEHGETTTPPAARPAGPGATEDVGQIVAKNRTATPEEAARLKKMLAHELVAHAIATDDVVTGATKTKAATTEMTPGKAVELSNKAGVEGKPYEVIANVDGKVVAFNEKGTILVVYESRASYEINRAKVSGEKLTRVLPESARVTEKSEKFKVGGKELRKIPDLQVTYEKLNALKPEVLAKLGIDTPEAVAEFNRYKAHVKELQASIETLKTSSEADKQTLDGILYQLGTETGAMDVQTAPVKGIDRALGKALSDYNGNPDKLLDLARGTLVFENYQDVYSALEGLKQNPKVKKLFIKDKFGVKNPDGTFDANNKSSDPVQYRDINATVQFENGAVVEVQMHVKPMLEAKEKGMKVPRSVYEGTGFTAAEKALADEIATRLQKPGKPKLKLPDLTGETADLNGHKLYELWREFPEKPLTEVEKQLKTKLGDLMTKLNEHAWEGYKSSGGKSEVYKSAEGIRAEINSMTDGDLSTYAKEYNSKHPQKWPPPEGAPFRFIAEKNGKVVALNEKGQLTIYEKEQYQAQKRQGAYIAKEVLPDGRVIATSHLGEMTEFPDVATYELAREKLDTGRLSQDAVPGNTIEAKVDVLTKSAKEAAPMFDALTTSVGKKFGAVEIHNNSTGGPKGEGVSLKDKGQAARKIEGPFRGNERFMTDMLRGTLVFSDIPSMSAAVTEIMRDPNVSRISVQDRIKMEGCNDMLLNIRFKNGHVAELQLHIPEIKKVSGEKGMAVPETVLGREQFEFSGEETAIVQQLKTDESGRRTLRGNLELPKFGEPLSSHVLYEVMRSMPPESQRTPMQQTLYERLNDMMITAHDYAMSEYSKRTGMDFKPSFNL